MAYSLRRLFQQLVTRLMSETVVNLLDNSPDVFWNKSASTLAGLRSACQGLVPSHIEDLASLNRLAFASDKAHDLWMSFRKTTAKTSDNYDTKSQLNSYSG